MLFLCSSVPYGNGFVDCFYFDEILKQVQDDGFKKGKGKSKCFFQALTARNWKLYVMEWNTAGDGDCLFF